MQRQLGTVRKSSEKVVAGDIFHATQALNAIGILGHVHCSTVQTVKWHAQHYLRHVLGPPTNR
jgi:hypothetical protein